MTDVATERRTVVAFLGSVRACLQDGDAARCVCDELRDRVGLFFCYTYAGCRAALRGVR